MFGWFKTPKRVVDGRAQPELSQQAETVDLQAGASVKLQHIPSQIQQRLPDGSVVTVRIPDRETS